MFQVVCYRFADNTQKNTNVPIQNSNAPSQTDVGDESNGVKTFTFRELATATKNFRPDYLLGEGGFGRVYKGSLENSGQVKSKISSCFLVLAAKLCMHMDLDMSIMINHMIVFC